MTLRLYNTLSRTKEDFVPIDPEIVRMYVCGPTVYDFAHIGNARPVIVFDVLFRLLRHFYGEEHVAYVRNITDIDDKINARALERRGNRNVPILDVVRELTSETGRIYDEDTAALGNLPPTRTPRATEHILPMVTMIAKLVALGYAYVAEGHVLFDVSSKADYGKLSRRSLDEMVAGARVEVAPYKRSPMDFVLWKPSDAATPGWDSPWGRGRPGWHIECSAMSEFYLGETFDIHGGGIDLVFPHHENEIAQSEAAHREHVMANYWLHNGFLNVEGEKMSKSLGNFVTIRDILRDWGGSAWSGAAIRLAMLRSHYRQPINWTLEELNNSREELSQWARTLIAKRFEARDQLTGDSPSPTSDLLGALSDDLNTPEALKVIRSEFTQAFNGSEFGARALAADLRFLGVLNGQDLATLTSGVSGVGGVGMERLLGSIQLARNFQAATANNDLGLVKSTESELNKLGLRPQLDQIGITLSTMGSTSKELGSNSVDDQVAARNAAREAKNFKEADRIRDVLLAKGIVLKDGPEGTTWEVKR
jgi:cysteinyl-tRNA synthetase